MDFPKGTGVNDITVVEHLTGDNNALLLKAQQTVGEERAWSSKGKLFVSTGNKKQQIKSFADLDKIPKQNSVPVIKSSRTKSTRREHKRSLKKNRNNRSFPHHSSDYINSKFRKDDGRFNNNIYYNSNAFYNENDRTTHWYYANNNNYGYSNFDPNFNYYSYGQVAHRGIDNT